MMYKSQFQKTGFVVQGDIYIISSNRFKKNLDVLIVQETSEITFS